MKQQQQTTITNPTILTETLEAEAILRMEQAEAIDKESIAAQEVECEDDFGKVRVIPSPNFTDIPSIGTLLPVNMASETITNLSIYSRQFDFVDFVKEQLGYTSRIKVAECFKSEQIDAIVLAIKSFEKDNAFILGDMTGIGKGRICAAIMRYAYQKGLIPIFLTFKHSLFSSIYRDLVDIDGLGYDSKKKKSVPPNPLILHPLGAIIDKDENVVYEPMSKRDISATCKEITEKIEKTGIIKLPKEFNSVMLPYSTISMTNDKQAFLEAISPNAIYIFDESHNAASASEKANILRRCTPLVEKAKHVLFSSATYAKSPNVFNLYVIKTALRTAVPSLESISKALKIGGENVSEYIASGLVKEGQMIRRERSFGDCKKVTEFVGMKRQMQFGQEVYVPDLDDNQKVVYDKAITYFKELRDFTKTELSKSAIETAIRRTCDTGLVDERNVSLNLADRYDFIAAVNADKESNLKEEFINANRGKWVLVRYDKDSITRYKQTFRESLFFAIKAKFAADKIIECLKTPVTYTNIDGSVHTAPLKPVIAVRNTGESMFNELKLKIGSFVKNDFSEYLRVIYHKLFTGEFVMRKVNASLFETERMLRKSGEWDDAWKKVYDYNVELTDFGDGGARITELQSRLDGYTADLPFSAIDYLRDRIESEARPGFYFDGNKPLYGDAGSANFKFEEATARNMMLVKAEGGFWELRKNDREPHTKKVFQSFNEGKIDVMLINQSAATGESAQSSPSEGYDVRPRNMFIVQFELDINIEVQKRGRVNRTGQLNSPSYTYIITKIPVELRTYLMFRKKLRKLDANTSADQTSSSKAAEITDNKGRQIEDIFNEYGFDVFKNFIMEQQWSAYRDIYDSVSVEKGGMEEAEAIEFDIEQFNVFTRELELYPADFQEVFFNEMNDLYIDKVTQLKLEDEYQAELEAKDYKAALKQRVVMQLNSGTTVFSLPLFTSDYYTLDDRRPLTKDKMLAKANALSVNSEGTPIPMEEFHDNLIDGFRIESDLGLDNLKLELESKKPVREDFSTDDAFTDAKFRHEVSAGAKERDYKARRGDIERSLLWYKPMTKVSYNGHLGYFIGYKIKPTTGAFKYTEGSIVFAFCFLSKYPLMYLKMSDDAEATALAKIQTDTRWDFTNTQSATAYMGGEESNVEKQRREDTQLKIDAKINRIERWTPDMHRRIVRRFYAGNILSGIVEATKLKELTKGGSDRNTILIATEKTNEEGEVYKDFARRSLKGWALTRFTNVDGSFTTAVQLNYDYELPLTTTIDTENVSLSIASDNESFAEYAQAMPFVEMANYPGNKRNLSASFVVWNNKSDNVIERGICLFKQATGVVRGGEAERSVLVVQIMNPYIAKTGKVVPETSTRFNKIYEDKELLDKFSRYLVSTEKKVIPYAYISAAKQVKGKSVFDEDTDKGGSEVDEEGKKVKKDRYVDYSVWIKEYRFEVGRDDVKFAQLFNELHDKYDTSFNFRSSTDIYFYVPAQSDVYDPLKITRDKQYEDGKYTYRFMKTMKDADVEAIPNLIERTYEGAYGGVVLMQPLSPTLLAAYGLKPYKLPSDVLVKLAFSVLSDSDKAIFARKLEDIANQDEQSIGEFVETFLTERGVSIEYFFGNLNIDEFGSIFKEYALKNDISRIVFEEEEKSAIAPISKVDFRGAESFLMRMLN